MVGCPIPTKQSDPVLIFSKTAQDGFTQDTMAFSRQEYWSGLPFSSPGNLPDPGMEPRSPAL